MVKKSCYVTFEATNIGGNELEEALHKEKAQWFCIFSKEKGNDLSGMAHYHPTRSTRWNKLKNLIGDAGLRNVTNDEEKQHYFLEKLLANNLKILVEHPNKEARPKLLSDEKLNVIFECLKKEDKEKNSEEEDDETNIITIEKQNQFPISQPEMIFDDPMEITQKISSRRKPHQTIFHDHHTESQMNLENIRSIVKIILEEQERQHLSVKQQPQPTRKRIKKIVFADDRENKKQKKITDYYKKIKKGPQKKITDYFKKV